MTEQNSSPEQSKAGVYIRKVRSFVRREGRLTKGQAGALERQWGTMGIDYSESPLEFTTIFGNDHPVVLEIGFGMGQSLVEMAKASPELNFVGIEVHRPGVGACLLEAETQGVTNLRVIEHDAVEVLEKAVLDGSLSKVQIFFPDPWHKKRHHKRRLIQPAFVALLRQKLKHGGVLHLATDWENYAEHMLEVMTPAPGFENQSEDNTYIPRPEERPLTKFEKRGHRLGHGVWDMKFTAI
ncbi:tRNA (guanosine(46)-N7)-methyltransferase TrmB [Aliidiomarina halalkaliphila]|uniref:tRNA (guanine-N(7)-)-methyltransferase n=1 Tax=Aliidiomarina halalkaliphila TaxID=2593535 RepID=A0A552WYQ6_9GAMM|nr:tRNA (guanosine(46)-N7)-methyltransferase TrmB [Aliidiomarina halalkaliphila]TRW47952.1 tRNA (guanosine(46)-N7)-methyltransferase TrmB [Aliidiomarina halalkaliphila]